MKLKRTHGQLKGRHERTVIRKYIVKCICIRFTSIYTLQYTNYYAVDKYIVDLEMISSPKLLHIILSNE